MMTTSRQRTPGFSARPRPRAFVGRAGAIALVTFRQGMRLRLWILAPLALVIAIVSDLSAPRFDPVFDAIPAAVETSLLVMTVLATVVGIFFATYPTPSEMDSKVAHTLLTKPVGGWEFAFGRFAGLLLLLAAMLTIVGAGSYIYILSRARGVQSLAAQRLQEARPQATRPADVNPIEAVAQDGPLVTYRYRRADAGPAFGVHFGEDAPDASGVAWVVGQSGLRLRWDLTDARLRAWAASGPCRLRIALVVHRPANAEDAPPEVIVRLADPAREDERMNQPTGRPPGVYEVTVPVPETGLVEVPVEPLSPNRAEGVLMAPVGGGLVLDVLAVGPGRVVGARADAVQIVGPAGQAAAVAGMPAVEAARNIISGRAMLVGQPELPRQMAVFRFDDVPAGRLGGNRTAVEIRFSLDAFSPATMQSAAQATFIRPGTPERRTLRFTPEGHRPTVLHVERTFWNGGPLEVRLECLTPEDYMGMVPESVRLRLPGDPFLVHYAKGIGHVLLFGAMLIAVSVFVSSGMSWFVSIFAVATLFALGTVGHVLLNYQVVGSSAEWLAERLAGTAGWNWFLDHLKLQGFLPPDSFAMGETVSWAAMAAAAAAATVVSVLFITGGAWLIRNREVAA